MSLARRRSVAFLGALTIILAACSGDVASPGESEAEPDGSVGASAGASAGAGGDCNITVNAEGQLEPLEDGFPNQPLTIFNIDDPGAPDGIYALHLKDSIERNNLTDQRVTVVDRPDFSRYGTWEALDFMAADPGGADGYIIAVATIPGSTTDLLSTGVVQDLGVSMDTANFLMTTESIPYALVGTKDAEWGSTLEELVEYAQANPNELKFISRGASAGLSIAFNNYQALAATKSGMAEGENGIPVETIVGGSHQEINAVIGSGEGDIAMTLADVARQFHEDGRIEVLMWTGNADSPSPFEDVPTAKEFFGEDLLPNDPWGQNRTLIVTENVPDCHHAWLVELFTLATADPEYQEDRLQVPGLSLGLLNHDETVELAEVGNEFACPILKANELLDPSVEDC